MILIVWILQSHINVFDLVSNHASPTKSIKTADFKYCEHIIYKDYEQLMGRGKIKMLGLCLDSVHMTCQQYIRIYSSLSFCCEILLITSIRTFHCIVFFIKYEADKKETVLEWCMADWHCYFRLSIKQIVRVWAATLLSVFVCIALDGKLEKILFDKLN